MPNPSELERLVSNKEEIAKEEMHEALERQQAARKLGAELERRGYSIKELSEGGQQLTKEDCELVEDFRQKVWSELNIDVSKAWPKRVIEVEAGNVLQVEAVALKELHHVNVIHEFTNAGNHRLILESNDGNPAQFSGQLGYDQIVNMIDTNDGQVYCATTEHYRGVLPEVFKAVPVEHIKQKR